MAHTIAGANADGLFIPSGARVKLLDLPEVTRLRLSDGRQLTLNNTGNTMDAGDPNPSPWQQWVGPKGLLVLASLDTTQAWGPLLHISVSYAGKRRPSWEDLSMLKTAFFGDVDACMILPKEEDFVHGVPGDPNTEIYHLWQLPQRWGIR